VMMNNDKVAIRNIFGDFDLQYTANTTKLLEKWLRMESVLTKSDLVLKISD